MQTGSQPVPHVHIGLMDWLRWLYRLTLELSNAGIDKALGVTTALRPPAAPWLGYDPSIFFSRPIGWLKSYLIIRSLGIRSDDVFLDIGAGSGRAVFSASFLPFRRLLGIELDPALCRVASANAARLRSPGRTRITFVCGDATDYAIPDDVTVIFMYNPFGGDVFARVMHNIFESHDRAPRRLRLVYSNPKEHDLLEATGRCRLIKRFRGMRPRADWARMLSTHVYEIGGAALSISSRDAGLEQPSCDERQPAPPAADRSTH